MLLGTRASSFKSTSVAVGYEARTVSVSTSIVFASSPQNAAGVTFYKNHYDQVTSVPAKDINGGLLDGETPPEAIMRTARVLAICRRMWVLSYKIYRTQHVNVAKNSWGSSQTAMGRIALALREALGKRTAFEKALETSVRVAMDRDGGGHEPVWMVDLSGTTSVTFNNTSSPTT